jgi:hypothetical protein
MLFPYYIVGGISKFHTGENGMYVRQRKKTHNNNLTKHGYEDKKLLSSQGTFTTNGAVLATGYIVST